MLRYIYILKKKIVLISITIGKINISNIRTVRKKIILNENGFTLKTKIFNDFTRSYPYKMFKE